MVMGMLGLGRGRCKSRIVASIIVIASVGFFFASPDWEKQEKMAPGGSERVTGCSEAGLPYYAAWNRTFGGAGSDDGRGVWSDGTSIFTCGDIRIGTNWDMFLTKWDSTGNLIWNRTWGGTAYDEGLAVWGDGTSIYVCGYTLSFGNGDYDFCLVKWNTDGVLLWNRTWGRLFTNDREIAYALWGNGTSIYVCGYTHRIGSETVQMALVKWNSNGVFLWSRTWDSPLDDYGRGVWANGTTIYTCGYSGSGLTLVKWDSSGSKLWNKTWGASNDSGGYSVWSDGTHVYTYGRCWVYAALVKWDGAGNELWNSTASIDIQLGETGNGLYTNGSDLIYTIGYNHTSIPYVPSDICLISWNATTGTVQWESSWGGGASDMPYSIWGNSSSLFICGSTESFGAGSEDMMVVRWDPNTWPTISSPGNATFLAYWPGSDVSWTILDDTPESTQYAAYSNGSLFRTGGWASGVPVVVSMATLVIGIHNVTIVATDGAGGSVQDSITVTIINAPPSITHPGDVTFSQKSENNYISWTITDASTGVTGYTILRDGGEVNHWHWESGIAFSIYINLPDTGVYNYTIVAIDGIGGSVRDTVIVTIVAGIVVPRLQDVILVACVLLGVVILVIKGKQGKSKQRRKHRQRGGRKK
jgi:hypothetical protein